MNHVRTILGIAIFLISIASAPAETIAVTVRSRSEAEDAPLLTELVEQGAMEYLFAAGHIVFDLDIDPTDEVYDYRAIDQASAGGAAYVVVLDLSFTTADERGLLPDEVDVVLLDVDSEDEMAAARFSADELESESVLTAETIADRLGGRASAFAMDQIAGGEEAW